MLPTLSTNMTFKKHLLPAKQLHPNEAGALGPTLPRALHPNGVGALGPISHVVASDVSLLTDRMW